MNQELDYSKGPFYGKNMYVPFFIYYNFPGLSASRGEKFDFNYHVSTYINQDFSTYGSTQSMVDDYYSKTVKRGTYDKRLLNRDYEGLTTEIGVSFNIFKNLQVGTDIRLVAYYGGFLDRVVEGFHGAFGLPNAGREFFDYDKIYLNIPNTNNIRLYLDSPVVSFGDIDLWVKYNFFENKRVSLAAFGAFKIPSGQINYLSGSGYPDFAAGILADFKPLWILSIYVQSGIVVPFDSFIPQILSKPMPMFNGLLAIELNPFSFFSLMAQFNFKTSPITKSDLGFSWNESFNLNWDQMALPQLNTLVGFIFKIKKFRIQVYFEEDSFFNQGTDWTLNFMFSHGITLGK